MSDRSPILTAEFRDCDAYFNAINDLNLRCTLHGLETSVWRIDSVSLPCGIDLQYCSSGSGALGQGASRNGGYELGVPATGDFSGNGKPMPVESALLMVPGSEFLVSISRSHSWFGIFVPESLADSIVLTEDAAGHVRARTQVLHNAAPARGSVPTLLRRFFANALAAPEMTCREQALGKFESELLAALGAAYGYSPPPMRSRAGRPAVVDRASVSRALDAIEASEEPMIAMAELVHITNVPERSLRAGFGKYLGMSPTRYMQLRMLNRARHRLVTSGPKETTVAEVAADLGVWDLGRFAARYRGLFGELPSSTLRQSS